MSWKSTLKRVEKAFPLKRKAAHNAFLYCIILTSSKEKEKEKMVKEKAV